MAIKTRINKTRRNVLSKQLRRAILGDENGNVDVPNQTGKVYIRLAQEKDDNGNALYSQAVSVWHDPQANYVPYAGMGVMVGLDENGELCVMKADRKAILSGGINPRAFNANDPQRAFVNPRNLTPAICRPVGTTGNPSTLVTIHPLLSDHLGDYVQYSGTQTSASKVDLSSYIPSSGNHLLAIVWLDLGTLLPSVTASTAQTITTAIDSTDVQECFIARPPDSIPLAGFKLIGGATNITTADLYEDYRMWLNAPDAIGYENPLLHNTRLQSGWVLPVHGDYYAVDADIYAYGTLLNVGDITSVNATDITGILPVRNGGTGADMSATGGTSFVVKQSSVGASFTSGLITSAELTTALTTPPAIGGTTPSTGRFTTLTATSTSTLVNTNISGIANLGFTYITPSPTNYLTRFWVPRLSDFTSTYFQDYQDEFAYFHKRASATVTASTAVSTGSLDNMFIDNSAIASWASGASVSPLVIECDTTTTPIANNGNAYFNVGLTFRNNGAGSLPSNIKVEFWNNTSGLYETVYDVAQTASSYIGTAFAVWLSPRLLAPSSLFNIYKVKLTLTVTSPLPATLSIQRFMLYHPTAKWDTFNLNIGGGTVWGATGFNAVASATQQLISVANSATIVPFTAKGATSQSANLQQWQDSSSTVLALVDKDGGAVFNENGTSTGDVRIEGDTDANLLFTDASADSVGIKTSTPNSRLQLNGSFALPIVSKSADYTATIDDYTIVFTASATLNLPTAVGITGRCYCVKSGSGVTVTIDPNGTETIDGNLTHSSTSLKAHIIQSDGANWWIISQY